VEATTSNAYHGGSANKDDTSTILEKSPQVKGGKKRKTKDTTFEELIKIL